MADWLSRATSLFQQPPPPPEPFEVECDCGGKVVGQRTKTHQKPTCSACERPVFVLPANVYPRLKPTPNLKQKPTRNSDELKSDRAPASTVVGDVPPKLPARSPSRSKSAVGRNVQPPSPAEPTPFREPRAPLMTPLRLIAAAMMLVSAVTVGGLWHRHRIENAKAIVSTAADAGMKAVRDRDFSKAAQELERARLAVDLLGRTDPASEDIRRLGREAMALAKLASSSLTDFLQETLANSKPDQTEPLRMASLDKNAWVIFDSQVIPASEGGNCYVVDAPILLREGIVRIEIESPVLRKASQSDESNEAPRIIFAAQLNKVSALRGDPPISVLTLNGKTAFLWTSYDTYLAVGYRPLDAESEKQTKVLLERQLEAR